MLASRARSPRKGHQGGEREGCEREEERPHAVPHLAPGRWQLDEPARSGRGAGPNRAHRRTSRSAKYVAANDMNCAWSDGMPKSDLPLPAGRGCRITRLSPRLRASLASCGFRVSTTSQTQRPAPSYLPRKEQRRVEVTPRYNQRDHGHNQEAAGQAREHAVRADSVRTRTLATT